MNLLCILISFTLVNVLVADDDLYLDKVFNTNVMIRQAEDVLPKIITNIVQADQETYTLKDIAIMLLVPESGTASLQERSTCQDWMQAEIKKVKVSDEPTTSESNALLFDNTVSKFGKITRVMTEKGVNAAKFLFYGVLGDFTEAALIELGKTRRVLIGEAVKCLVKGVLEGENHDFQASKSMCNLIGLIRSIQNPFTLVKNATVQGEYCILEEVFGNAIIYQHDENNNYWIINKESGRGPNLTDQLLEFLNMVIT